MPSVLAWYDLSDYSFTMQRWLAIRLDFLGSTLTFSVAVLTVAARFTLSPAATGVVLAFILSVQAVCILPLALSSPSYHIPVIQLDGATVR